MLCRLDTKELVEWEIYNAIEPFGDDRADWHTASICQAIMTVLSAFCKNYTPPKLKDLKLKFEPHKPQDPEEMKQALKMMVLSMGGEIRKAKK